MKNQCVLLFLFLILILDSRDVYSQTKSKDVKHVKVYYEPGGYGGWPANYGIWIWDNEILVGFQKGLVQIGSGHHDINRNPETQSHPLARSMDGGETWKIETPANTKDVLAVPNCDDNYYGHSQTEGLNFTHPDFALTARFGGRFNSNFWYSFDRGRSWAGPCMMPTFDTPTGPLGIAARTDYIIDSKKECMLFLTTSKSNDSQGRVSCIKTTDGGKSWSFVSWVGPEPTGGYAIMPASVRLSPTEILVTIRNREGTHSYISAYRSSDNGVTWEKLNNAVEDTGEGNPPAMVKMKDGRVCLIYGYRAAPYEGREKTAMENGTILAKISNDKGKSWSTAYVLRDDGSGRDVGYPRAVQRPDGKIVAVYYFMDKSGPERYIAATIWTPPSVGKEIWEPSSATKQ